MKPRFAELVAALAGTSTHSTADRSTNGMRAARVHAYGGAEVVRIDNTSVPRPMVGHVRVRVIASGVNPHDWKLREGYLKEVEPRSLPFTLGTDVSGIVDLVGPGVSNFAPADEVFGRLSAPSDGSFAEYVIAAESDLLRKPSCLSHLEAAALPLSGLAAHAALIRQGLRPGDRVLILGGAGGVGHLAVQLAKTHSAWVAATASRANLEFVHSLGADLVVERSYPELSTMLDPVDVIIDTVGAAALLPALKVLKRTGEARSIVPAPMSDGGGVRETLYVSARSDRAALAELARLMVEGNMRIEIPRVFPLIEVGRALALSQSGHTRGKIVLSVYER
jgi:NADPH:quinone reductase-like Zn-dependent oxidoreductase